MSNVNARLVSPLVGANRLASSPSLKLGYEDYVKARPFNYDITDIRESSNYERGRAFAIWCQHFKAPRSTWRNGVAAKTVVQRIVQAIGHKYVI